MHGSNAISLAHLSLLARYLSDPLCEPNRPNQTTRKIVIIVTFMRSGSTFLGELFNVHNDAFYQFEPLHPWSGNGCSSITKKQRLDFLSKVANCEFEDRYNTSIPWSSYMESNKPSLHKILDTRGTQELCTSSINFFIIL